jgi:hypothetical protein
VETFKEQDLLWEDPDFSACLEAMQEDSKVGHFVIAIKDIFKALSTMHREINRHTPDLKAMEKAACFTSTLPVVPCAHSFSCCTLSWASDFFHPLTVFLVGALRFSCSGALALTSAAKALPQSSLFTSGFFLPKLRIQTFSDRLNETTLGAWRQVLDHCPSWRRGKIV